MFGSFRRSMAWLHTWSGLVVSWLLYFIFLTGTLGYFDVEIDRWMKPELPYQGELVPYPQAIAAAQALLDREAPSARQWTLTLPETRNPYLHVEWQGAGGAGEADFDLAGNRVDTRSTGGGQWLYELHFRLHYLPIELAYWIVCIVSMVMLVALVSGVVVHRRIFVEFFTFRPGKGRRSWLDLHNLLSVSALPFHLMITYSGLLFLQSTYMPIPFAAEYGDERPAYEAFSDEFFGPSHIEPTGVQAPAVDLALILDHAARRLGEDHAIRLVTVYHPNDAASVTRLIRMIGPSVARSDRLYYATSTGEPLDAPLTDGFAKDVRMALVNLHEGLFAGAFLRWLYFVSGLVGTAMIATGLVIWAQKRGERKRRSPGQIRAHTLVERLNWGVILGLPVAIGVYFWANRLLPAGLDGRASWEQDIFFATLAIAAAYAAVRRPETSIRHLLAAIAALFGTLPFVCEALGGYGLASAVRSGDGTMLGFNLVLLAAATIAAVCLLRFRGPAPIGAAVGAET